MSNLRKIRKNANNYELKNIYENMSPEQYRQGVKIAVETTKKELIYEFQKKYEKLANEYNRNLKEGITLSIDTISVELLYELANQLGCFEKDPDFLEDKIFRVQEIYDNTMNAIKKYAEYKNDNQARKKFEAKRKKVEKMFNIKF